MVLFSKRGVRAFTEASSADGGGLKDSYAPSVNWTGFYFGAHVGALYQGGSLTLGGTDAPVPDTTFPPNLGTLNAVGGVLGGYNYQTGSLVLGVEGDVGWTNSLAKVLSGKYCSTADGCNNFYNWHVENDLSEGVTGHIRGRLGYAAGPLLLYVSGGLALADANLKITGWCNLPGDCVATFHGGPANTTLVGGSVGAGAEYALTPHITLRGEYLFDDYGRWNYQDPAREGAGGPLEWQVRQVDLQTQTFRVAVNYKFGGYDPLK